MDYRNRIAKFGIWLCLLGAIPIGAIGYFGHQSNQAKIAHSKAIIAQAQPSIIVAQGQRAISQALALTVIMDKVILGTLIFGIIATLLIIIALLAYILFFKKEAANEKSLQSQYPTFNCAPRNSK